MAQRDRSSASSIGFWLSGIILALVVAGSWMLGQQSSQVPDAPSDLGLITPRGPSPAVTADDTADMAEPGEDSPSATNPAAGDLVRPSFDTVLVNKAGSVVASGRANPRDVVSVFRNGTEVAQLPTNDRGEWVWTPDDVLPVGNHALQLQIRPNDGPALISDPVVVLGAPPVDPAATEQPSQTAPTSNEPPTVIALGDGETAPQILQQPGDQQDDALSLETVQWGIGQPLSFSGVGPAGQRLRLALDGDALGTILIGEGGQWDFSVDRILATGPHEVTLQLDDGPAQAFPFNLDPEPVGDVPVADAGQRVIVVQPGSNLWRIAEATYGSGFRYTLIFDANRAKIADPNVIYPGQIFTLPAKP
ncbi:MAG: LysM peptidoglycan-binding domain-containing protein [Pseudomonadota bacterium]